MEEKSRKNNISKGILIGCGIASLLLTGILGSYAFFISSGTNNPENISSETGTLALTFADGNPGINEALEFGNTVEKTFMIENTGSLDGVVKINFEDLVNTYLEGSLTCTLSYSNEENGDYIEIVSNKNIPRSENSSTQFLANGLKVPAGTKYYYKLVITLNYLEDIDQTEDLNAIFSTHFKIEEGTKILTSKDTLVKLNLTVKGGQPNFAEPAITDETVNGLFSLGDNYGTSYYFRGTVENNYLKFAGFYWRIIRINGDGSLRIIYDGEQAYSNGIKNEGRLVLTNQSFNSRYNDVKYVGYMYGPAGTDASTSWSQAQTNIESSTIKTKLDEWYVNNIKSKGLDRYVADSIFCNDRSIAGKSSSGLENDTGLGYGSNITAYRAYKSFLYNYSKKNTPQLICSSKNDRFTVNDTQKGNGSLTYPIGLITIDEDIIAGGGTYDMNNKKYYLYKGFNYWTMTPSQYVSSTAVNFPVNASSSIGIINYGYGAVPVINLTPEYIINLIGDGTASNPYRV